MTTKKKGVGSLFRSAGDRLALPGEHAGRSAAMFAGHVGAVLTRGRTARRVGVFIAAARVPDIALRLLGVLVRRPELATAAIVCAPAGSGRLPPNGRLLRKD